MKIATTYKMLRQAAVLVLCALPVAGALAQAVVAPPLPPGSDRIQVETGQSGEENRRMIRAHRHNNPGLEKRDVSRDDMRAESSRSRDAEHNERPSRR